MMFSAVFNKNCCLRLPKIIRFDQGVKKIQAKICTNPAFLDHLVDSTMGFVAQ